MVGGNYQVTHILELDDGAEVMVDATWHYETDAWDEEGGWTLEDITTERDLSDKGFAKRIWRAVFEQGLGGRHPGKNSDQVMGGPVRKQAILDRDHR